MSEKDIIFSTYYDTADVYRISSIEDENGITKQKRVKVYENIRCSLSQRSTGKLFISAMSNKAIETQVLFTDDVIKIVPADIIHITNIDKYFKAGSSFIYPNSHSETIVTLEEKA